MMAYLEIIRDARHFGESHHTSEEYFNRYKEREHHAYRLRDGRIAMIITTYANACPSEPGRIYYIIPINAIPKDGFFQSCMWEDYEVTCEDYKKAKEEGQP